MKKKNTSNILKRTALHLFFIIFCLTFILPFITVISVSFTSEASLLKDGYNIIPKEFSLEAYKYIFASPQQLINSYGVTIFSAGVGTFLGVLIMALVAYPISRPNFKYRKPITFYIFFTMIFGGGLIPTYIVVTQYLHLGNKLMVYIVLQLLNAFNIIVMRTFFSSLPGSLVEAAKIDGASELGTFWKIILPLSKPVIATVALLTLLQRWNDWNTSLIYVRDKELYTLQYLLQKILREAEFVQNMARDAPNLNIDTNQLAKVPTEGMRFAMAIVAAGPMLIVFPFFQKYFTKGLTVGAVKG